jgi:hypothetical protein
MGREALNAEGADRREESVAIGNGVMKQGRLEVSWSHAEKNILADFCRIGTDRGFYFAVLVGSGCNTSDTCSLLVDCLSIGLVLRWYRPKESDFLRKITLTSIRILVIEFAEIL